MSPVARVPYPAAMPSRSVARHLLVALVAALALAVGAAVPATASSAAREPAPSGLTLEPVVTSGLESPIAMATRTGSTNLFVAERPGRVRVLHVSGDTVTLDPTPLLDISDYASTSEGGGLLGLTFDPTGARLYVHYTNAHADNRLVEYTMANGGTGATVDLTTRRVVLKVHQGESYHKGGDVTFGPDGHLYLALGDGDVENGPLGNGQSLSTLLGKVIRINPRAAVNRPYRNPLGNPFVTQAAPVRREIWLYGVRNPWRISFDRATGDLYVADVGEHTTEEVNVLLADSAGRTAGRGANLGWNQMEANLPFNGGTEPTNHTRPAFTYPHAPGGDCSVIGGYVYRGTAIPSLVGTYVYGDRCSGRIGGFVIGGAPTPETTSYPDLGISAGTGRLQSFGQGPDGELYVLSATALNTGTISRIEPVAAP